jgi:hypothetical protein
VQNETTPWRTLFQLAIPYRRQFIFIALLALIAASIDLIEPLIYRRAINDVAGLFVDQFNDNPQTDLDVLDEPAPVAAPASPTPAALPTAAPSPSVETRRASQSQRRQTHEERERHKHNHERRRQIHEERRLEQTTLPHRSNYVAPRTPKQTLQPCCGP